MPQNMLPRNNSETKSQKHVGLVVGLIGLALLVVGCFFVIFFLMKDDSENAKREDSGEYILLEESDAISGDGLEQSQVMIIPENSAAEVSDIVAPESESSIQEEPENSVVSEESEVEKEITAEIAYDDILLEYFAICKMDSATYEEHGASYPNTNHGIMKWYHEEHDASFYYMFYDLDQNGTDELLIGYGDETYAMVVDGYAFNGEEAVKIIEEQGPGTLLETIVFEDGSFGVYGGMEGYFCYFYVKRLAEDGYSLDTIFDAQIEWTEEGYMDMNGLDVDDLTEEQYIYIEQGYDDIALLDWQPIL